MTDQVPKKTKKRISRRLIFRSFLLNIASRMKRRASDRMDLIDVTSNAVKPASMMLREKNPLKPQREAAAIIISTEARTFLSIDL